MNRTLCSELQISTSRQQNMTTILSKSDLIVLEDAASKHSIPKGATNRRAAEREGGASSSLMLIDSMHVLAMHGRSGAE
eukprot:5207329-Amphidinium_carterae.1